MPKLAVITSCYNHGQYLAQSIDSVRAQTERDIEHIIVIDGATDNSEDVANEASWDDDRVIVCRNTRNLGLAYSQNFGILHTDAPWVLKVDADDKIAPTYVEEILKAADANPRANVIFSPAQHFGERTDVYRYPEYDPTQIANTLMIAGCAALKRDVVNTVGGLDETMRFAEDWDMYIRAELAVGLVPVQLPEPRWYYRVHNGPRASAEGEKHFRYLQAYWKGHTKETALARSRSWGQWCETKGLAA